MSRLYVSLVRGSLFVLMATTCLTGVALAQEPPSQARPNRPPTPAAIAVSPDPDATTAAEAPQDPLPEPSKPTRSFFGALVHNLGDDIKHLPRRNSVYWFAGGGALALAAHPADLSVNRHLLGSSVADTFFVPGKYIGATEVQIGASLATYLIGRSNHEPRVQHLGMDLLEAQILAEGLSQGLKLVVRRKRPVFPDGSTTPGYGFPSGHATVTFASATVLQQHLGWRAAVPVYVLATYVATSRLHDNRHYLSDVIFGSATGIVIGRSVTWHGRNTYTLVPVPLPGGLGVVIAW
jgi:membrane-associated phospholipid phosphatase